MSNVLVQLLKNIKVGLTLEIFLTLLLWLALDETISISLPYIHIAVIFRSMLLKYR